MSSMDSALFAGEGDCALCGYRTFMMLFPLRGGTYEVCVACYGALRAGEILRARLLEATEQEEGRRP